MYFELLLLEPHYSHLINFDTQHWSNVNKYRKHLFCMVNNDYQVEEASTHESALTHAGNVFLWIVTTTITQRAHPHRTAPHRTQCEQRFTVSRRVLHGNFPAVLPRFPTKNPAVKGTECEVTRGKENKYWGNPRVKEMLLRDSRGRGPDWWGFLAVN